VCVDTTDVMCVMPFGTTASGIDDEITREELKKERGKRRYIEMADTARHEDIESY
jgi:hypothetical protein